MAFAGHAIGSCLRGEAEAPSGVPKGRGLGHKVISIIRGGGLGAPAVAGVKGEGGKDCHNLAMALDSKGKGCTRYPGI